MRTRLWAVVGSFALLLTSCSQNGVTEFGDPAFGRAATTTSTVTTLGSPGTTNTTVPPTTATPVLSTLSVSVTPAGALVLVEDQISKRELQAPVVTEVAGTATVTISAPGFNSYTETVNSSAALELWLDPEGQIVHKLGSWASGPGPKQVAFTPDGSELWVTQLRGTGLEVHDPITRQRIAEIDLPRAGSVEIIFNRAGTLAYVSQMETASVYEIDVASRDVLRRMSTASSWSKVMALTPDESTLYVSNWLGNDVSEIDLSTGSVTRRLPSVVVPRGLYVTQDGERLFVAGFENGDIQVFDLATGDSRVLYRSGGAMRHLVADADGEYLYGSDMSMSQNKIVRVDLATDEVAVLATVDNMPNTIDITPDGKLLFVSNRGRNNPETYLRPGPEWGTVVVVDTTTGERVDAIIGGNQTTGLDVSPDGRFLVFSDFLDDRLSLYEIPPYESFAIGGGGRWGAHLLDKVKQP